MRIWRIFCWTWVYERYSTKYVFQVRIPNSIVNFWMELDMKTLTINKYYDVIIIFFFFFRRLVSVWTKISKGISQNVVWNFRLRAFYVCHSYNFLYILQIQICWAFETENFIVQQFAPFNNFMSDTIFGWTREHTVNSAECFVFCLMVENLNKSVESLFMKIPFIVFLFSTTITTTEEFFPPSGQRPLLCLENAKLILWSYYVWANPLCMCVCVCLFHISSIRPFYGTTQKLLSSYNVDGKWEVPYHGIFYALCVS